MPTFLKSLWGVFLGFRPLNLLLIFGLHKITQWVFIGKNPRIIQEKINSVQGQVLLDELMWASILLAAAGYLINDHYDEVTDTINKAKKQTNQLMQKPVLVWLLWAGLNLSAVGLGFSIGDKAIDTQYGFLFLGITGVLWAYNLSKWSKFMLGPVVISALVALNLVLIQDLALNIFSKAFQGSYSIDEISDFLHLKIVWIWRIAYLAFLANLTREIIKDIEDINGDQNAKRQTIPIVLGIERTAKLAVVLGFILVLSLGAFVAFALRSSIPLSINFTLVLILAIWITFKCSKIERPSQAKSLSLTLKLLLSLGLLCLCWL